MLPGMDQMDKQDNRRVLLNGLPKGPVAAMSRSGARTADLNSILQATVSMAKPSRGEWPLLTLMENARSFLKEDGREYEAVALAAKFEDLVSEMKAICPDIEREGVRECLYGGEAHGGNGWPLATQLRRVCWFAIPAFKYVLWLLPRFQPQLLLI